MNSLGDAGLVCRRCGISRPTLREWWRRYQAEGIVGLEERSRRPREWGRCHDVKNLFIVDGSIWVTSGGVNPTSTIQALALYIADSIKKRLATLLGLNWGRRVLELA